MVGKAVGTITGVFEGDWDDQIYGTPESDLDDRGKRARARPPRPLKIRVQAVWGTGSTA